MSHAFSRIQLFCSSHRRQLLRLAKLAHFNNQSECTIIGSARLAKVSPTSHFHTSQQPVETAVGDLSSRHFQVSKKGLVWSHSHTTLPTEMSKTSPAAVCLGNDIVFQAQCSNTNVVTQMQNSEDRFYSGHYITVSVQERP